MPRTTRRINHIRLSSQLRRTNMAAVRYDGTESEALRLRQSLMSNMPNRLGRAWLEDQGLHLNFAIDDDYITIMLSTREQADVLFDDNRENAVDWTRNRRRNVNRNRFRQFGVELEVTNIDKDTAAVSIVNYAGQYADDVNNSDEERQAARNIVCVSEGYNHQTRRYWKVVTDASVPRGCEVVSPPLRGAEGRLQLKIVMKALVAAGAKVDRSCGTHVHVDTYGLNGSQIASVVEFYATRQTAFDSLMPRSRRSSESEWARAYYGTELQNMRRAFESRDRSWLRNMERYKTVNVTSFPKYGTLEFRQHGGTLNYGKLINWIDLLVKMMDTGRATFSERTELSEFVADLGLDPTWYVSRAAAIVRQEEERAGRRTPEPEVAPPTDSDWGTFGPTGTRVTTSNSAFSGTETGRSYDNSASLSF